MEEHTWETKLPHKRNVVGKVEILRGEDGVRGGQQDDRRGDLGKHLPPLLQTTVSVSATIPNMVRYFHGRTRVGTETTS